MTSRTRALVVTLDTLGASMAGPAIRAWEISRALSGHCDVTLVTFGSCDRQGEGFAARRTTVDRFRTEVEAADVVVVQGFVMATFPWMQDMSQCLVVDLYDPFQLETLEVDRHQPEAMRWEALRRARIELEHQLRRGDLFCCASPRQRDLWIGQLSAAGRLNPATYDADPGLQKLIVEVPFGVQAEPPQRVAPAIKGVVPGIGVDDRVILWGGGVYNWFDPLTLVRAVAELHRSDPRVRLFFLGMRHPNPDVPEMRVAAQTRALSDELGLTGSVVFFNEEWVPYERRAGYLLDADVGVSCHFQHVETEFSFRTRILDYLWAGLPVVCTQGDSFAALVQEHRAGVSVPPQDVSALVEALRRAIDDGRDGSFGRASAALAEEFSWARVLEPIVAFCRAPERAPDAGLLEVAAAPAPLVLRWRSDAAAAWRHLRRGGPSAVWAKVRWRLQRGR